MKGNLGRISVVNDLAPNQQPVISCLAQQREGCDRRALMDTATAICCCLLLSAPCSACTRGSAEQAKYPHTSVAQIPDTTGLKPAVKAVCAGAARAYLSQHLLTTGSEEVRADYPIWAICSRAICSSIHPAQGELCQLMGGELLWKQRVEVDKGEHWPPESLQHQSLGLMNQSPQLSLLESQLILRKHNLDTSA